MSSRMRSGYTLRTSAATPSQARVSVACWRSARRQHLRQRNHPAPPLRQLADVEIVFADEIELAVGADLEDGDARRDDDDLAIAADGRRRQRSHRHHSAGGIQAERAGMGGADIGMLECGRLAGLRVDGEGRDIAFAGAENLDAVDVLDAGPHRQRDARAVAEIDDLAVGMNVNRSGALNRDAMVRIGQGFLGEQRLGVEIAVRLELVDDELALPFDRQIDPRLSRMEVEVPRPEAIAAVRLDLSQVRQHAVVETVNMQ